MAKKAKGRVRPKAVEEVQPARPMLFVEGHALREVSSFLTWRDMRTDGTVQLRLATGPATRDEYSLDVEVTELDITDGFKADTERSGLHELLHFVRLETVVTLHFALGLLIEKARVAGWHDLQMEAVISGGIPQFPAVVPVVEGE